MPGQVVVQAVRNLGDRENEDQIEEQFQITCLLYTSDAADERSSVDLGGRRIIKNKKIQHHWKRAALHEQIPH